MWVGGKKREGGIEGEGKMNDENESRKGEKICGEKEVSDKGRAKKMLT